MKTTQLRTNKGSSLRTHYSKGVSHHHSSMAESQRQERESFIVGKKGKLNYAQFGGWYGKAGAFKLIEVRHPG